MSWFTSQSGVSLLVSLIALIGVLFTTWWNNRAADKRRREDQVAADRRRKDDQTAEDARRKADNDRREREHLEQLQREDWARQRRAVADCVAVFRDEFPPLGNLKIGIDNGNMDGTEFLEYISKGQELLTFYRIIIRSLDVVELEVSNVDVKSSIHRLRRSVKNNYEELIKYESHSRGAVGVVAMKMNAIDVDMEKALEDLVAVTADEFLGTQG